MSEVTIIDGHGGLEVDWAGIHRRVPGALAAVLAVPPGEGEAGLPDLDEVEVTLLNDAEIARIHGEFMDDPTPTDVITFHHGEILISGDTARVEAARRGWPLERELLLYLIHGLLHLHGHTDADAAPRERMWAEQEAVLNRLWPWPDRMGSP